MLNTRKDMIFRKLKGGQRLKISLKLGRGWVTELAVGEIWEAQTSQNKMYHVGQACRSVPTYVAFSYLLNFILKIKTDI